MNNVVLWSRAADRKILVVFGSTCALLLAAAIGTLLPPPIDGEYILLAEALTSTVLLVFVWAAFRLVRPFRYSEAWDVAEFIAVPVIWVCLLTALGMWFSHIGDESYLRIEILQNIRAH